MALCVLIIGFWKAHPAAQLSHLACWEESPELGVCGSRHCINSEAQARCDRCRSGKQLLCRIEAPMPLIRVCLGCVQKCSLLSVSSLLPFKAQHPVTNSQTYAERMIYRHLLKAHQGKKLGRIHQQISPNCFYIRVEASILSRCVAVTATTPNPSEIFYRFIALLL